MRTLLEDVSTIRLRMKCIKGGCFHRMISKSGELGMDQFILYVFSCPQQQRQHRPFSPGTHLFLLFLEDDIYIDPLEIVIIR